MKLLRYFALIVGVVSMLGISDCDRTPPELTELEKLPPATQVGKYTFGCLVNGKAMVPNNSLDVSAIYQYGVLQILGRTQDEVLTFFIEDSSPMVKEYFLDDASKRSAEFLFSNDLTRCEKRTDGTNGNTGTLRISKFDLNSLIVSGTFELEVSPSDCPKYIITDGRFDIKIIP